MWSIISPAGTEVPLTGLSVSVRSAPGAGMPPIEHITSDYAQESGAYYQRSLAGVRRLMLRMASRQRHATLYKTRQALINVLNPDLVRVDNPAYLVYTGVTKTVRLPVVYDSGLENGDDRTVELQFFAYDPVWTATTDSTQALAVQTTLSSADYLAQRSAGVWEEPLALDGAVSAILVAADGTRSIGGEFSGKVKRLNETSGLWETLSGLNGDVHCLGEGPDGTIYAGGSFTVPGSFVAYWDDSTSAWVAMGTPDVLPNALAVGNDGTVYIGGFDFSSPTTGETVKQWDGSTGWTALGTGAGVPGGTVHAMLIDASGDLLIGGAFTGGVKRWNGTAWATLGSGLSKWPTADPVVRALARGPDGIIYAGGDFQRADGTLANHVARWNGVNWLPLGSGMGASVHGLAVRQSDGMLFAVGQFIIAGSLSLPGKMAQWNGYTWFPLDIYLDSPPADTTWNPSASPDVNAIAVHPDGAVLAGYGAEATATTAAVTTATNTGSAAAYPVLTIQGPGRVYQLANWTAGEAIYLNLTLQAGETLTIDLRPAYKTVTSSFRGNLLRSVVPGSTLATWRLLPGSNQISLLVSEESASATMTWQERHWSIDGVDE